MTRHGVCIVNWICWAHNLNALTNSRTLLLTTTHANSSQFAMSSPVVALPGNGFQQWPLLLTSLPAFDHLTTNSWWRLTLNSWLLVDWLTAKLLLAFTSTVILGSQSHGIHRLKSHCDRRSVGQPVLVSSTIWGPRPDFCYCQTFAVLSMWGALSEERKGLSFVAVTVSSTRHPYLQFYLSEFRVVICQEYGSPWMHVIYSFICNSSIYIQGLCQSMLGTADRAPTHVAHVTTAA
jgi:hypothetical protein